jgi:hypothetical protein
MLGCLFPNLFRSAAGKLTLGQLQGTICRSNPPKPSIRRIEILHNSAW